MTRQTATVVFGRQMVTGNVVTVPLRHMAICGQTQEAGKTTALEGMIFRSGLRALTFVTKRGEGAFHLASKRQTSEIAYELGRTGREVSNIELGNELKALVEMGFFTKENKWVTLVDGAVANVETR